MGRGILMISLVALAIFVMVLGLTMFKNSGPGVTCAPGEYAVTSERDGLVCVAGRPAAGR